MTDEYDGTLKIVDDDPRPQIRVSTPHRVAEGKPATVDVSVEGEAGYPIWVGFKVIKPGGGLEPLRVRDVPTKWLAAHDVSTKHPGRPLYELDVFVWDRVRPGGDHLTLSIPTRKDGVHEGVEALALRIYRDRHHEVERTIRVVD